MYYGNFVDEVQEILTMLDNYFEPCDWRNMVLSVDSDNVYDCTSDELLRKLNQWMQNAPPNEYWIWGKNQYWLTDDIIKEYLEDNIGGFNIEEKITYTIIIKETE